MSIASCPADPIWACAQFITIEVSNLPKRFFRERHRTSRTWDHHSRFRILNDAGQQREFEHEDSGHLFFAPSQQFEAKSNSAVSSIRLQPPLSIPGHGE